MPRLAYVILCSALIALGAALAPAQAGNKTDDKVSVRADGDWHHGECCYRKIVTYIRVVRYVRVPPPGPHHHHAVHDDKKPAHHHHAAQNDKTPPKLHGNGTSPHKVVDDTGTPPRLASSDEEAPLAPEGASDKRRYVVYRDNAPGGCRVRRMPIDSGRTVIVIINASCHVSAH